ncbi:MAG TPA: AtpZ/AtpI family protein [Candidatus Saccharimonadales bacterium]|nr:AtpZ/AtpI family protein [Candidatus Saccharimonadales bacterium]
MQSPHAERGRDDVALKTALLLLVTLADTTWRIFVPVGGLAGIGIWADLHYHTKPWITFSGVAVGFVIAFFLIRQQLKAVMKGTH